MPSLVGRVDELAELVQVMAHDLKNPLAAILTNLHFLRSTSVESSDPEAGEALSDSVALCEVMDRLLRNLDLVARGEASGSARQPTSLRQVAEDLVTRHRPLARAAGLELTLPEPEEVFALVDRDLFVRAADNLVANALEHAPSGSRIVLEVERRGAEAWLTVVDVGPPIPAELRAQAVSPAGQGRLKRCPEARYGRGLGLLCADLAARGSGARFEMDGESESRLRLVAPLASV